MSVGNPGQKILVVEDERSIAELLAFNLGREGFEVREAVDGLAALVACRRERPDLVILDVMLPGMDGLEVCRQLRRTHEFKDVPIIMLTARREELDRVLGLEMGADDYVVKPFSPREVVARVKAILRRTLREAEATDSPGGGVLKAGDLELDQGRREVRRDGSGVELTFKEFEILKYLMHNPGRVISREIILEKVWGYDYLGDARTVDVHIRHLREKLEEIPARPRYVETVRGVGYRLRENS